MSTLFFQICFYVSIALLTLTLFVCVGKFFCVSWIENIFDAVIDNELVSFLLLFNLVFAFLYVLAFFFNVVPLMGMFGLFGTAITTMSVVCISIIFCMEYLFPFMEELHESIRRKRGK